MQEMWAQSPGQEDPLEKGMATLSNILASEIPWTEEPGRLQSMGCTRVGHYLATKQQQQWLLSIKKIKIMKSNLRTSKSLTAET